MNAIAIVKFRNDSKNKYSILKKKKNISSQTSQTHY